VRVGVLLEYPGMDQAQYDAVERELKRNDQPAPGEVLSVVGPLDGGFQIFDVWESQEAFETYMRERVQPVFEKLGVQAPRVKVFPVYDLQLRV
jgi:hypothetical protein